MENLIIQGTKTSPFVSMDAAYGICEIRGSSYPENTSDFYASVLKWINRYGLEVTGDINFVFRLDYLNSSSIKYISDIVDKLDKFAKVGLSVKVNWYYKADDEDIKEMGEELRDEVSYPFEVTEE